MSPEARAYYENHFLPRYRQILAEVERTPLVVLVWGPGPAFGDLHDKRLQILRELRLRHVTAIFSEEVDEDNPRIAASSKAREIAQAIAADFIVVIQALPGSIGEAHDVGAFLTTLGSKVLVFVDETATAGYGFTGVLQELRILYGNVETFRYPDDINSCRLTGTVLSKVSVLRHAKWRRSLFEGSGAHGPSGA